MIIALRCIAAVFGVSLIEPHLRVIFLGGIERKLVSVTYNRSILPCQFQNVFFYIYKLPLYDKMEHLTSKI